jgi:hypothetical protein
MIPLDGLDIGLTNLRTNCPSGTPRRSDQWIYEGGAEALRSPQPGIVTKMVT